MNELLTYGVMLDSFMVVYVQFMMSWRITDSAKSRTKVFM